jgi:hypothetical protein
VSQLAEKTVERLRKPEDGAAGDGSLANGTPAGEVAKREETQGRYAGRRKASSGRKDSVRNSEGEKAKEEST